MSLHDATNTINSAFRCRPFASPNGLYNLSRLSAWWSRLGIKEVDDGIWLVGFCHYDLGYIDLEQR